MNYNDMLKINASLLIQDIYRVDAISYVKIVTGFYPTYHLNLETTEKEIQKLQMIEKSHRLLRIRDKAVLIVNIHEIKKFDFSLGIYHEDFGHSYIEDKYSHIFWGKGQLTEVILLDKIELSF